MPKKWRRWLNSKAGKQTLYGVLGTVVVLAVVGQLLGWWAAISDSITGTVVTLPDATYDPPQGGYTCLPTCSETDGKFFSMPGEGLRSFGGAKTVMWISVPGQYTSFEVGIFDGDSGKTDSGDVDWWNGNWDNVTTESTYTIYADPLKDGTGTEVVGSWNGNQDNMPNNDWFTINLDVADSARGPSGHYFYRLEATRPQTGTGINAFKLRSNGYLTAGRSQLKPPFVETLHDADFAFVGMLGSIPNDIPILYPQFNGDYNNPGPSTYTGDWTFKFYVPYTMTVLELWDGDFDRGTAVSVSDDTDDPNTTGKPDWANPNAVDERAGGRGAPADDNRFPIYRREPPVHYVLIDPSGDPIYDNQEPSGTEEWERFVMSTDPSVDADLMVGAISPGFYTLHIEGLDLHNTVWIRGPFAICDEEDGCGPPEWPEGSCPRTIGYWKNNVLKVLIQGRTGGVQESVETLEAALRTVALASPLYRHGIDVTNPQRMPDPVPLTSEEANMILQRSKKDYPGDERSMLARALQQNLASWLNLGSGKVGDTTIVTLNVHGGLFGGTLLEALREAETLILSGGDLERAKDIGDQINNGLLGEEAETSTCEDYHVVMPPEKQPPDYEDMPEAPVPPPPPNPTPAAPVTCDAPRVNTYQVENPTNNPFYGIRFEFVSGDEVKKGDYDEFKIVLTADQAAGMTSLQMEVKAGTDVGSSTITLDCQFDAALPCGEPVLDDTGLFAFYFMGAEDNGDGTLTLIFQVQNMSNKGLSHATIGLPNGVVPSSPEGSYQSEVCP